MSKDDQGLIHFQIGKLIGDCPILLVETLAIREVAIVSIQEKFSNIIVGSDSHIAIQAIIAYIKAPGIILNIVVDIFVLVLVVRNIKFLYCNRQTNTLADTIAKMLIVEMSKLLLFINKIVCLCYLKKKKE